LKKETQGARGSKIAVVIEKGNTGITGKEKNFHSYTIQLRPHGKIKKSKNDNFYEAMLFTFTFVPYY